MLFSSFSMPRTLNPWQHKGLHDARQRNGGFSLVELMVAVVIGLIAVIVMMQMFAVSEEQKRRTVGSDDALSSGAIALNGVQRDIQQSGWGFAAMEALGCNLSGLVAGGAAIPLNPVTINPRDSSGNLMFTVADANTDVVMVVSGNGNGSVDGELINSQPALGDPILSAVYPNVYDVQTAAAFTATPTVDRVFATPGTRAVPCALSLTTVRGVNRPNVAVTTGVASMVGGRLFNMGASPIVRVYAVVSGNLTMCDYMQTNCAQSTSGMTAAQISDVWSPIANNIVSLRAQYGRDSATGDMDGMVDTWDKVLPTTTTPISTTSEKNIQACGLMRISAVRLALVARSALAEKTTDWPTLSNHVTTDTPTWMGSGTSGSEITLSDPDATWPTWRDFRYRVFQTVIPLRNITTRGVVTTC